MSIWAYRFICFEARFISGAHINLIMANCEMCGTNGGLQPAIVEGVQMLVCPKCSKYGKLVSETPQGQMHIHTATGGFRSNKKVEGPVEFIVPNAGDLIKAAREKRGMRQVDAARMLNIRESIIHQIEGGNTHQTLDIIKKIEVAFAIKLVGVRSAEEQDDSVPRSKVEAKALTIGDLINKAMKK